MSTLRSLRLLGAVEAGTVNGTQLQTFLTDAGRASELSVLLTSRGQSRRMAGSPLTMAAIVVSPAATNIIFQSATAQTSNACQAVVESSIAMSAVSNNAATLNTLGGNLISWGLFSKSAHYETNVRTVIANYAGVNPVLYPTVTSIVADADSMANVAATPYAMSAVVASPATTAIVAASSVAMALVASNHVAIDIVAAETNIMGIIANSTAAMTEINSRAFATSRMANYPGAISAIANSATAWVSFRASPHFSTNLALALANLIGVNPSAYPSLSSIIADGTALAKVASNKAAVEALASNSDAMSTLAVSPNIGIILSSTIAMGVIGPNATAMGSFLGSSGAWSGLFASSVAKGYIVSSTPLVNIVAANSALLTYLGTLALTASATGIPDGNATALQPFTGIPSKVLVLSAKEAGIAATFSPYNFGGSPIAGSQGGATLSLTAAANLAHVAGYTNMTWNLQGIGVTAATLPIIKYVDMT
jgi:hypothetical protein